MLPNDVVLVENSSFALVRGVQFRANEPQMTLQSMLKPYRRRRDRIYVSKLLLVCKKAK